MNEVQRNELYRLRSFKWPTQADWVHLNVLISYLANWYAHVFMQYNVTTGQLHVRTQHCAIKIVSHRQNSIFHQQSQVSLYFCLCNAVFFLSSLRTYAPFLLFTCRKWNTRYQDVVQRLLKWLLKHFLCAIIAICRTICVRIYDWYMISSDRKSTGPSIMSFRLRPMNHLYFIALWIVFKNQKNTKIINIIILTYNIVTEPFKMLRRLLILQLIVICWFLFPQCIVVDDLWPVFGL